LSKLNSGIRMCGIFLLWAIAAVALPTQTFNTFHNFAGTDGASPAAAVVQAANGNLFGTTADGGANGDGTIFKITPNGTLTTIHSFDGTDGANPSSALIQGTDGNIYGTTNAGGTSTACAGGCGTIFRIVGGMLMTLHSFSGTDGAIPQGGVIQGPDGNFWGTTLQGGPGCGVNPNGCGTAFNISPSGTFTLLHNFAGLGDGGNSNSVLVFAKDGDFYGTATNGGTHGKGAIFKLTLSGIVAMVYSFCAQPNCTDGANPVGGLVQDPNGALYGTTSAGGSSSCSVNGSAGCGTVFNVTLGGSLTTLHAFSGTDGSSPVT
jgi:uncharacterized repeat protein (TIGR03803 family)